MKELMNQRRFWDNSQTIRYVLCWQTFLKIYHPLSKQYLERTAPAASNWKNLTQGLVFLIIISEYETVGILI